MKTKLALFLITMCLLSCRSELKKAQVENSIIKYDTIIVDNNTINQARELRNLTFKKINLHQQIDSLKLKCTIQGIKILNEKGLPFDDYQTLYKYYTINIPRPIYKTIFPNDMIRIDSSRFSPTKIDEQKKQVTIYKGPNIREERKFKNLLSLIEKEKYLQLLITKQGKFTPEIELVTVSKDKLNKIDQINLYGGIYDSYDINYWHSIISKDYNTFTLTKVKNTKRTAIKLDTTITNYYISEFGEIFKQ